MSKIDLSEEENKLFDSVQNCNVRNSYEENQISLEASLQLTELLLERKAIPLNRLKFFIDRKYQHGRSKLSRKEVFESNGTKGKAILKHPHFIKYLDYFVNGANVSQDIYDVAEASIESNQSQDDSILKIIEYIKLKGYISKDRTKRNKFADELFKLVVDLGFDTDSCFYIRKAIMSYIRIGNQNQ